MKGQICLAQSAYWDRGRRARPERVTERSGVQRSQPLSTVMLGKSNFLRN